MSAYQATQYRPTKAVIHLQNLAHNILMLRQLVGENQFFCPMIKANAYGHGDIEVALKLQEIGVQTVGVSLVEEGIALRQMGIQIDILIFGSFAEDAISAIEKYRLTPVIGLWEQIESIQKKAASTMSVHLKFNTGMNRLGFHWQEAQLVYNRILDLKNKIKVIGICTHLHSAEDSTEVSGKSYEQFRRFQEVERVFVSLKPITHTLNSAGILNFIKMRNQGLSGLPGISLNQGVRPGLSIYGCSPLKYEVPSVTLKPVMSLRSEVIRYHHLQLGEGVSYGHSWRAGRESTIGVIPLGYADGIHRILSNRGVVLFNGQRVPVVGTICMDYLMIDVTDVVQHQDIEQFKNAEVTFFGYDSNGNILSANEVAEKVQTIPWEVLTSVGERVPRIVEDDFQQSAHKLKEVRA